MDAAIPESAQQLLSLASEKSLTEVVLYYWLGRWPQPNEQQLLEEMMIIAVDHRSAAPSAAATMAAANEGQNVVRSVEAGIGEINDSHGGAIEGCAVILQSDTFDAATIVATALETGRRLPGFGHRLYKQEDPRAVYLADRASELGFSTSYLDRAREIEAELEHQKGKKLILNVDGAMAAVLSELGVEPRLMNAFFLWPRVAGLVSRWQEAVQERKTAQ